MSDVEFGLVGPLHDSSSYEKLATRLVRAAANYHFGGSRERLVPAKSEKDLRVAFADTEFPAEGYSPDDVLQRLATDFMGGLTGISNPRFLGYILTRPVPEGHIFDVLANATHASPGAAHLALSATLMERQALSWLSSAMGLESGDALFTSGGCESLLVALKCARDAAVGERRAVERMVLFVSESSHYCVGRGWDIIGGAAENLVKFDPLRLDDLTSKISQHKAAGQTVVGIVASLGTTNAGAIEPIDRLADVAEHHSCWLHVDGAYGGAALMLEEYASLRAAVRRANSFSVDGHKWLGLPLGTGMIFLRPGKSLRDSFSFSAVFTNEVTLEVSEPDQCQSGLQGTRALHGPRVWSTLALTGLRRIKARLRRTLETAQTMARCIERSAPLKLLSWPELTVLNFTIPGATPDELVDIARRLAGDGTAFVTVTRFQGKPCFRAAIISYETTDDHVVDIVEQVACEGRKLLSK